MLSDHIVLLSLLPALVAPVLSQTYTNCNPLTKTCPADPALGIDYTFNFTAAPKDGVWNTTGGTVTYGDSGAEFTIRNKGDSPTIQSNFYIFFGRTEVHMRSANGTGIVSSVVLESDDLDEVDWEFIGGNNTVAETNYFGKGNTTNYDRAIWFPVTDPVMTFHNYTTVWTAEKLEWFIDGNLTRTLLQAEADDSGYDYPQTPMYVRIGIWAGGDTTENSPGTVEWAGGATDYSKGPYTMYVKQVRITDFSSGKEYTYTDMTGNWKSILITGGNSTTAKSLLYDTPTMSPSQRWAASSPTFKVIASVVMIAAFTVLVTLYTIYCVKQRRKGRLFCEAQEAHFAAERRLYEEGQREWRESFGMTVYNHDSSHDSSRETLLGRGMSPMGESTGGRGMNDRH